MDMIKVKALAYSSHNNYTAIAKGTNISGVLDRILRETVKATELYASDIIYDIDDLRKAMEDKKAFQRFVVLREGGVTSADIASLADFQISADTYSSGIQFWVLSYTPAENAEDSVIKFERLSVSQQQGI